MGLLKRNPFGHILFFKNWLIKSFGLISHRRYNGFNTLQIEGSDIIRALPGKNVLFVSNHQTYFADVAAMLHVFNAALKGRKDNIKGVIRYLNKPKLNIYFVAAKETMKKGILPRIFGYAGAITVQRTWRESGENIQRPVNPEDSEQIGVALNDGWVITFPQGTTKPFKPIRKGTAHIIKQYKPIVVPIVIDGFRRSFNKQGLLIKKRGILQSIVIKEPLDIDYDKENIDELVEKISFAIEQHPSFMKLIPEEMLKAEEELNRKRDFWEY